MGNIRNKLIGVDIGGTNMRAGLVENGTVLKTASVPVHRTDSSDKVVNDLFHLIDALFTNSVEAIGIGVPAVVDVETGVVYDVQNIPAWKEVALKSRLENRYSVPVFINNDANCFAIGESHFGKAVNYANYVALSLGTGLGMGIVIDKKLYCGVLCGAGEIGMLGYRDGIMEEYTGSFFFEHHYGKSAKLLFEHALENDSIAIRAFEEYGSHLSEAIKAILYLFSPEAIILGGSISNSIAFFEKTMRRGLDSFAYQKQIEHLKIEKSDVLDSPILGAAALCL